MLVLLFVAVAGAFYGMKYFKINLKTEEVRQAPRVVLQGAQPIDSINANARKTDADQPRITVPDEPPSGSVYHVKAKATGQGNGSKLRPWNNLQHALCMLRPGDRLLIWPGGYEAPVAIDGECVDGTAERPIEVYSSDHAYLAGKKRTRADEKNADGSDSWRPVKGAVMLIARSHWKIAGFEVQPNWNAIGIEIGPNVTGIELDSLHLWGAIGDAISVRHGSSNILLEKMHIHHVGSLEGKSQGYFDGQAAAIRIAPGVSGLTARAIKTHNIAGKAVQIISPEDYPAVTGLQPANGLELDVAERANQEKWW